MKKHLDKVILASATIVTLSLTLVFGGKLVKTDTDQHQHLQSEKVSTVTAPAKTPGAEKVSISYVYYYRTYKGWIQRRKWNRTQGYWVDPCWYNVKRAK